MLRTIQLPPLPALPLIGKSGMRFYPPPRGSVLYLPGYPGLGAISQDFSGNANHGTLTGHAAWAKLPSGQQYVNIPGTDDCIAVAAHASMVTDTGTILIWQRPNYDITVSGTYLYSQNSNQLAIYVSQSVGIPNMNVYFANSDSGLFNSGAVQGRWIFQVWTFTKNGASIAYENGVAIGNSTCPNSSVAGDTVKIGARSSTGAGRQRDIGLFAHLSVILTPTEIANLFARDHRFYGI